MTDIYRPAMRHGTGQLRLAVFGCLALLLVGCGEEPDAPIAPEAPTIGRAAISFDDIDGWADDRHAAALPAMRRTCNLFGRRPDDRRIAKSEDIPGGTIADWRGACAALDGLTDQDHAAARLYFETWFKPWRVTVDGGEIGLFTGYFEPELEGSDTRSAAHPVPLHKRPDDLVLVDLGDWRDSLRGERIAGRLRGGRLVPFDSRGDILAGTLSEKEPPLMWLSDPIDAFFLHIQGSGRVRMADGSIRRVGYDGHNGHVYYPIGRYLIESGEIAREDMSLQVIRTWLEANPARQDEVMNLNPSYIFFREIIGDGPIGAQGVALTPGRSLAVDLRFHPLGAPVWLDADYTDETGKRLRRLMVAQDTGGAIRGPVRGDVFWGPGEAAARLAGPMAADGSMVILLPKTLTATVASATGS